jgi:hypothetical protein
VDAAPSPDIVRTDSDAVTEPVPNDQLVAVTITPIGSTELVLPSGLAYKDLSQELAQRMVCLNLYFGDQDLRDEVFTAKASDKTYQGTRFASIFPKRGRPQIFLGEKLKAGKYILMPLCVLSTAYMPPNGTLDHIKKDEHDFDVDKDKQEQAEIKIGVRPEMWNRFTVNEVFEDTVVKEFFKWMGLQMDPLIKQAMEAVPLLSHNTTEGWRSVLHAKDDATSLAIWATTSIFRTPSERVPGDNELLDQLISKTYRADTDLTSYICLNKTRVLNPFHAYRLTSARERAEDDSVPLVVPMTRRESSLIKQGDLAMPLISIKGLLKTSYHPSYELEAIIWAQSPKYYVGRKDNSLEEFLRCVPDCPEAPSDEVYVKRRRAKDENMRRKMAFEAKMLQAEAANNPLT